MKSSSTLTAASATRWGFVARQTAGRVSMRKIAVSELDRTQRRRGRNRAAAQLDAPELADRLTKAFRLAVKRVKRSKRQNGIRT
jgi:hypothetical protein